jgi:endonuclease-8
MPEGHVLHRAARLQGKRFNGRRIEAESPQGRFADGAAAVDGQKLEVIEARGKHLFYWFESGVAVHVHLGLFGKFKLQKPPFPDPSPNARLLLSTGDDRMHLAGPTTCELVAPDEVEKVLAGLGPDPILDPVDGVERFGEALSRRSVPIGRALLDQKAVAGLGNVYRSELLFLIGLNPFVPSRDVPQDSVEQLWELAVEKLRAGERSGRIVTVDPIELDRSHRSDLKRGERLYAYKRRGKPCRRCGSLIQSSDIDDRTIWWCPDCQPA